MSVADKEPKSQAIPGYVDFDEYIEYQVNKARQHIRSNDLMTAITGGLAIILGYLLVFVIFDHWIIPNGFDFYSRLVLLAAVLGIAGYWFYFRVRNPYFHRINKLFAAKELETAQPQFQNNLVSLVDLQESGKIVSPEIIESMRKRAAVRLEHMDVDQAIDRNSLMRSSYILLAVVVAFCIYSLISPKKISTSLQRALFPVGQIEAPTQTEIIEVLPGNIEVLSRSQLQIKATIVGVTPEEVYLKYTTADQRHVNESIIMSPASEGNGRYEAILTGENGRGLLQNITYFVEAGDDRSTDYQITIRQPPSAKILLTKIEPPSYTKLAPQENQTGEVDGYESSVVTITAEANTPLTRAVIIFSDDQDLTKKAEEITMSIAEGTRLTATWPLRIRVDGTFPRFYHIACRNDSDETDPNPQLYPVNIRPDLPPEIVVHEPTGDLEAPANAVIPILYEAKDQDFMLKSVMLRVEKTGENIHSETLFEGEQSTTSGKHRLDLDRLRLKNGDIISWYLQAYDNKAPASNRKNTKKYIVKIVEPIAPEEVQNRLQQREQELAQNPINSPAQKNDAEVQKAEPKEPQNQPGQEPKKQQPGQNMPQEQQPDNQQNTQDQNTDLNQQPQQGAPSADLRNNQQKNKSDSKNKLEMRTNETDKNNDNGQDDRRQPEVAPDGSEDDLALNKLMEKIKEKKQQNSSEEKPQDKTENQSDSNSNNAQNMPKDNQQEQQNKSGNNSESKQNNESENSKSGNSKNNNKQDSASKNDGNENPSSEKNSPKNDPSQNSTQNKSGEEKSRDNSTKQNNNGSNEKNNSSNMQNSDNKSPQNKNDSAQNDTPVKKENDSPKGKSNSEEGTDSGNPSPLNKNPLQEKSNSSDSKNNSTTNQTDSGKEDPNQTGKNGSQPGNNEDQKSSNSNPKTDKNSSDKNEGEKKGDESSSAQNDPNGNKNAPSKEDPAGQEQAPGNMQKSEQPGQQGKPENKNQTENKQSGDSKNMNSNESKNDSSENKSPDDDKSGEMNSSEKNNSENNSEKKSQNNQSGKPQNNNSSGKPENSDSKNLDNNKKSEQSSKTSNEVDPGDKSTEKINPQDLPKNPRASEQPANPEDAQQMSGKPENIPENAKPQTIPNKPDSNQQPAPNQDQGQNGDKSMQNNPDQKQNDQNQPNEGQQGSKKSGQEQPDQNQKENTQSPKQNGQNSSQQEGQKSGDQKSGEQKSNKPGDQTGNKPGQSTEQGNKPGEGEGKKGENSGQGKGQEGKKPGEPGKPGDQRGNNSGEGSMGSERKPGEQSPRPTNVGTGGDRHGESPENENVPFNEAELTPAQSQDLVDKKQAAELVLKELEGQINDGDVDPELLKELGWTEDQLKKFQQRLAKYLTKKPGELTPEEQQQKLQFEEMLKQMKFSNQESSVRKSENQPKRDVTNFTPGRGQAPPQYREQEKAYERSLSSKRNESK